VYAYEYFVVTSFFFLGGIVGFICGLLLNILTGKHSLIEFVVAVFFSIFIYYYLATLLLCGLHGRVMNMIC